MPGFFDLDFENEKNRAKDIQEVDYLVIDEEPYSFNRLIERFPNYSLAVLATYIIKEDQQLDTKIAQYFDIVITVGGYQKVLNVHTKRIINE